MSNPSLQYLAASIGVPVSIVETHWRQAKKHAKADGGSGYLASWQYLAKMLSKTFSTRVLGRDATVIKCGPVHTEVTFHNNPATYRIPSCLLILESATST